MKAIVSRTRFSTLFLFLLLVVVFAAGSWVAGLSIQSPAEMAARTAPPAPSPILVPVEQRVLASAVVTRGTARFGLPQSIVIVPSALKPKLAVITVLPARNTQVNEGSVLLSASGRPVFVLRGQIPAYRDLIPGNSGEDVLQLEKGLERLGFDPGPVDGVYDEQTSAGVAAWYAAGGWKPLGATTEQLANIRALEHQLAAANSNRLAAADALAAAPRAVAAAQAKAATADKQADAEVAAKTAVRNRAVAAARAKPVIPDSLAGARNQVVPAALPKAATAKRPAGRGIAAAKAAVRNRVVTNPTATRDNETRATAELELAQAAATSVRLAGEAEIQAALDAQKAAERHAALTDETAAQIAADLDMARRTAGVQVPADEIVFLPALPVRVEQVKVAVGDAASGPVMTVTNNQLAIDSSLPLDSARLVKPGMAVVIDEPALGIKVGGVVHRVADTPGTDGVQRIPHLLRGSRRQDRHAAGWFLAAPDHSDQIDAGSRHCCSHQRPLSRPGRDV